MAMSINDNDIQTDRPKFTKKPGNKVKFINNFESVLKDYPFNIKISAKKRWDKLSNMDRDVVECIILNKESRYNRDDPNATTIGLHAMRAGTPLEGLFTLDVPDNPTDMLNPGPARMLFKPHLINDGKTLDYIELLDIVDPHLTCNDSSDNLIPESKFKEFKGDRSKYILVKPERTTEKVAVKKYINT